MILAVLQQFGFSVASLLAGVVNYTYYILFGFIIASILFSWFPATLRAPLCRPFTTRSGP
jgi:hypothetical protein